MTLAAISETSPGTDVALKQRVHRRLVDEGADERSAPGDQALRVRLAELLRDEQPLLAAGRFELLLDELTDEVVGLGALEPLLNDPTVTEVMINGPGKAYVERHGRLEPVVLGLDAAAIVHLVERVVAPLGLRLDRASPMVDARLADGSRLHAVIPPLAVDGPCVTIRRFGARAVGLEEFHLGEAAAAFLTWAVGAGWNLLVAGATSAGKTTLLNALSQSIPHAERVVTIEETAELRLAQPHLVRLEARPPNAEGVGGVTVRELVRAALRMRPDRLIVGEVRSGEALDMLQALNTGHDGSMSTIHANGTADALARLETLVLLADSGLPLAAVRAQVIASVDAVVFVARACGRRTAGRGNRGDRRPRRGWRAGDLRTIGERTGADRSSRACCPTTRSRGPRRDVVPVVTLVLAIVGPLVCAALLTAGHRAAAADRVRALGPPRRWRLPARVRRAAHACAVRRRRRTRTGTGGGIRRDRSGRRRSVRRRFRAGHGTARGPRRVGRGPRRAPFGALPSRAPIRGRAARAPSNRSRQSSVAAGRWRQRWNDWRGPTHGVRSRSISGGYTFAPNWDSRWPTRWPGGRRSTTSRECEPPPVRCRWPRRWVVERPTRSTVSRRRCDIGSTPQLKHTRCRRKLDSRRWSSAPRRSGTWRSRVLSIRVRSRCSSRPAIGRVCLVVGLALEASGRAVDPTHRAVVHMTGSTMFLVLGVAWGVIVAVPVVGRARRIAPVERAGVLAAVPAASGDPRVGGWSWSRAVLEVGLRPLRAGAVGRILATITTRRRGRRGRRGAGEGSAGRPRPARRRGRRRLHAVPGGRRGGAMVPTFRRRHRSPRYCARARSG